MKKERAGKPGNRHKKTPGRRMGARETRTLRASLKRLHEQADQLGLLDPVEVEPAMIYSAAEGKQ